MLGLGRARANREHRFAADNLSAYIDGEMAAAERSRVERHLAACAECRRDVATLHETVALLRRVPLRPVPRSFALPASARAAQARHRRWNSAFGAMRTATVTIATMLVLVFAGDAALSAGLVSLPSGRTASEGMALLAPDRGQPQAEELAPMIAEGAPEAAPRSAPEAMPDAAPQAEPEGAVEQYAGPDAAPTVEAPAPGETARALQAPRETWPGPDGQSKGVGGVSDTGGVGGAGGAGGAGGEGDMGGPLPVVPRVNGLGGAEATAEAAPAEGEPEAALAAEPQAESLTQSPDAAETPAEVPAEGSRPEEPQPEAMLAPKLAPTPEPQPTQAPEEPTAAPEAEEPATPEAMAMRVAPEDSGGEPGPEVERVMPLDHRAQPAWWQAAGALRLIGGFLAGMLLIALAGMIWTGYKRDTP